MVILSNSAFDEKLSAINAEVKNQQGTIGYIQSQIDLVPLVVGRDECDCEAEEARKDAEDVL